MGRGGQGESVWLAWLLHATLTDFAVLADARGDKIHAGTWRAHAAALKEALEREAWDGDWYRRAWFDDGSVLGSASNDECRIDSIVQSWAVISGVADAQRGAQAMAAVGRELIDNDDGLALLFTPPFDHVAHDPGYIKAYPPGIRENGGQYTHAAAWSVIALARLGEGAKAARSVLAAQSDQSRSNAGRVAALQGGALCNRCRRLRRLPITSAMGAGPGTQALPGGCIVRGSKASWAYSVKDRLCILIPASLTAGQASR